FPRSKPSSAGAGAGTGTPVAGRLAARVAAVRGPSRLEEKMEPGRKPRLLDLCIRSAVDNLRTLNSVDIVAEELLKRILPHCTLEQLTHIESCTHVCLLLAEQFIFTYLQIYQDVFLISTLLPRQADLTDVTDVLWKRFFQREFGEDNMNLAIKRMKENGVRYKWKKLFEARTEKQKQVEARMSAGLKNKYQAANAAKQSKQIKVCTKIPPNSKRSFWGGSGSSSLSNSSYKSPILKKARMEVDSRAKMQAAIQRNTFARSSQPARLTFPSEQTSRTTTIHRPNSTITITKPTGPNRPIQKQNTRPKF
uniref:Elongin-A n=1 Tax=Aegilops tauschii subsp. strangulata TaxID=200361 RepID=A0A452XPV8_AEGTS